MMVLSERLFFRLVKVIIYNTSESWILTYGMCQVGNPINLVVGSVMVRYI